ncbi:MAG TPA: fused MFS/spermidine synthase, partial [Polyangiales bacterium]|nr:fused MFS/spermidine synthase [Polyangiales bacterium]
HFGVDPKKIRFVSRDARQFIEREPEHYDFIIVDLFANEYVPAHCVTREFFSQVKAHLNPGGVVFVNTNMFDVPFELPDGTREPTRVNRHVERTLREAGFPSLFANNFFHSLVAYPTPQPFEQYLAKVRASAADPERPAATRAALGLMARTTFEVPSYPRTYEAFTDEWSPDLVLERKWNQAQIYDALREAPPSAASDAGLHPALRIVRARLFADRASGARSGAITDAAALVTELDQLDLPLTAADRELAARYLRFELSELPELQAHSPWAQLAAEYAGMYAAGQSNDYEKLAQILGETK